MKLFGGVKCGPRENQLDFGGNPDHDPDPRILQPEPGMFLKDTSFTAVMPIDSQE